MIKITVYLDDGRCPSYEVESVQKAREHAAAILKNGWRNVTDGIMEYYPVWRILKVTFPYTEEDLMGKKYEAADIWKDIQIHTNNPKIVYDPLHTLDKGLFC
jgi:hypothetical protein